MHQLFDYQKKTVSEFFAKLREGYKNVLIILSCGSGKSTIVSFIVKLCVEQKRRALFIVHKRDLVSQFDDRLFQENGFRAGIILSGKEKPSTNGIYIASRQTLSRRIFPEVDIVFVDEAHNIKSNEYKIITEHYKEKGVPIGGMTATPRRGDGSSLGDVFETYINPIKMLELISLKRIVGCTYVEPDRTMDFSLLKMKGGEFTEVSQQDSFNNNVAYGDVVKQYKQFLSGKNCIVFNIGKADSQIMHEEFLKNGISSANINDQTPTEERERIYEAYKKGEILVINNVRVCIEGTDLPNTAGVILKLATNSEMYYVQMCGRAQRASPGKESGIVIDLGGNVMRHWPVEHYDINGFDLNEKKKSKGEKKKEEAKLRKCDCGVLSPVTAKVCVGCGIAFKIKMAEILLSTGIKTVVMDVEALFFNKIRLEPFKKLSKMDDGSLLYICACRGYKYGWAINIIKERYPDKFKNSGYGEMMAYLQRKERESGLDGYRSNISKT